MDDYEIIVSIHISYIRCLCIIYYILLGVFISLYPLTHALTNNSINIINFINT